MLEFRSSLTFHRAYIAASRRSDRSLEARVESARRASEIHKRRTGRSLKVTEQDVINEEMYEEEDDDLPMQYRRLTAHLQTGSADFNRRLAAYLTNHVAMRSALDQAISDSYAQQFPNAPNFAHNQYPMFPSPIMTQGLPMVPPGNVPQSAPPGTTNHPHPYRQTPYPTPGTAGYRPSKQSQDPQHKRSASIATPHPTTGSAQSYANSPVETKPQLSVRRMSMPAAAAPTATTPLVASPHEAVISSSKSSPSGKVASPLPNITSNPQSSMGPPPPQPRSDSGRQAGLSPLTTTLPYDSQLLLGSALNTDDRFSSMLMAGNSDQISSMFGHSSFTPGKDDSLYPSLEGMNATLAPSAFNMSPAPDQSYDHFASAGSIDGDMRLQLGDIKGVGFASANASATNTPAADNSWDTFINEQSWADNVT